MARAKKTDSLLNNFIGSPHNYLVNAYIVTARYEIMEEAYTSRKEF